MTTSKYANPVIIIRNANGRIIGCCSSLCYDDDGFRCDCICGGVNHGVGRKQAAQNVADGILIDWTKTWSKDPKSECKTIIPRGVKRFAEQRELFDRYDPALQETTPCPPRIRPY